MNERHEQNETQFKVIPCDNCHTLVQEQVYFEHLEACTHKNKRVKKETLNKPSAYDLSSKFSSNVGYLPNNLFKNKFLAHQRDEGFFNLSFDQMFPPIPSNQTQRPPLSKIIDQDEITEKIAHESKTLPKDSSNNLPEPSDATQFDPFFGLESPINFEEVESPPFMKLEQNQKPQTLSQILDEPAVMQPSNKRQIRRRASRFNDAEEPIDLPQTKPNMWNEAPFANQPAQQQDGTNRAVQNKFNQRRELLNRLRENDEMHRENFQRQQSRFLLGMQRNSMNQLRDPLTVFPFSSGMLLPFGGGTLGAGPLNGGPLGGGSLGGGPLSGGSYGGGTLGAGSFGGGPLGGGSLGGSSYGGGPFRGGPYGGSTFGGGPLGGGSLGGTSFGGGSLGRGPSLPDRGPLGGGSFVEGHLGGGSELKLLGRDSMYINSEPPIKTEEPGLNQAEIEKKSIIAKFNQEKSKTWEQELVNCVICWLDFEEGDDLRFLECIHRFHKGCIDEWLTKSKSCPICQVNLKEIRSDNM